MPKIVITIFNKKMSSGYKLMEHLHKKNLIESQKSILLNNKFDGIENFGYCTYENYEFYIYGF